MRQITDARAPFPSIDEALAIGKEYLDREIRGGGSPVGIVAENQHGGYFARIAWTTPARGSRHKRNRFDHHAAEIGRINPHERVGREEGDLCRRGGCPGTIELPDEDSHLCCRACRWGLE
jgi:hypothetical protein